MRSLRFRRRSLGNGLALLFFAVTAASFAVLFFVVVPPLESNLERQQLRDLAQRAAFSSAELERAGGQQVPADALDRRVLQQAEASNARVTLLGVQQSPAGPPPGSARFYVVSDSAASPTVPPDVSLAERALRTGGNRVIADVGPENAMAARQLYYFGRPNWIVLYTRDLGEVAEILGLVRSRIVVASALALLVALLGSYVVARRLARRVRRLEVAAREVAEGREVAPIADPRDDELGRLTRTFDEMQLALSRIERARRDFIANASHELRTPLFSLGGFVELLQDEDLDEATRDHFLATMGEQVTRLQKLAVDLLDLSRLDADSLSLSPEAVNLAELAREVAGEFAPGVARHESQLDLRLPERGVVARCDRVRTAQIVRILLDNALRHTPTGTRITVTVRWQTDSCEIVVADDGPGLPSDADAQQIFERFFTADAASGSGLGLAIGRELAERMDGWIDLRARPGETAFTLRLPPAAPAPSRPHVERTSNDRAAPVPSGAGA